MRLFYGMTCLGLALLASASHGLQVSQAPETACPPGEDGVQQFGPATAPSDSGRVYSSVLSPSGDEFYFFKQVGPGDEDYWIYLSVRAAGRWGPAELLDLGGDYSDLYPSPSPDGKRLAFASYRPAPGDTSSHRNAHLWYAVRTPKGLGEPRFITASTYGYYHSGLRHQADGSLRFVRTTPDWRNSEEFSIQWSDTAFSAASSVAPHPAATFWRQRLGDSVYVWGAMAGPAGVALVQISRVTQPGGRRSPAHYFVTREHAGEWSTPVPAGGGLAEGSPNFAWFSTDSCYIHYTRDYTEFVRVPTRAVIGP